MRKHIIYLLFYGLIFFNNFGGLVYAQENSLNLQELLKNIEKESKWIIENIDPQSREHAYQLSARVLAEWISLSKQNAIDSGVRAIPNSIKIKLRPYFSETLLESVRFRVGDHSTYSLSNLSFEYGDAGAITLDNVIVFYSSNNASNASLWAHELQHVHQYRKWGVRQFAENYLRGWQAIEKEAEEAQIYYSRANKNN